MHEHSIRSGQCSNVNLCKACAKEIGPIRVPPPGVTLRMRWLLQSATITLPFASAATPVGP